MTHYGMGDIDALNVGMLFLRVSIGLIFASHGYNKFFGGGKIPGTANWFNSIGMKPGKVHAYLAATTEMTSGILLALGLLTSFAAAGMVAVMTVAAYTVHRKNGFFVVKDGIEYNVVLACVALSIAVIGPWKYSLDHAVGLAPLLNGWVGLAIVAVLGVGGAVTQLAVFFRAPES